MKSRSSIRASIGSHIVNPITPAIPDKIQLSSVFILYIDNTARIIAIIISITANILYGENCVLFIRFLANETIVIIQRNKDISIRASATKRNMTSILSPINQHITERIVHIIANVKVFFHLMLPDILFKSFSVCFIFFKEFNKFIRTHRFAIKKSLSIITAFFI